MMESNTIPTTQSASSLKMLQTMVGIGIVCALMIVLTYEGTLPRVEKLKAEALEKAIFKVLPGTAKTQAFRLDENNGFLSYQEKEASDQVVYAGFDESNQLVGIAIQASGQGYADILRVLYGYDPEQQTIVGLHVLESKETPGLGDKIEKDPAFLENFTALDVSLNQDFSALNNIVLTVKNGAKKNPWEVDGITGATISSRAIGNILGMSTAEWIPLIYNNKTNFTWDNPENTQQ
jgi:electron transport complex protein RnfG